MKTSGAACEKTANVPSAPICVVVIAMEAPRIPGWNAANDERASRNSGRWRRDPVLTCDILSTTHD